MKIIMKEKKNLITVKSLIKHKMETKFYKSAPHANSKLTSVYNFIVQSVCFWLSVCLIK